MVSNKIKYVKENVDQVAIEHQKHQTILTGVLESSEFPLVLQHSKNMYVVSPTVHTANIQYIKVHL